MFLTEDCAPAGRAMPNHDSTTLGQAITGCLEHLPEIRHIWLLPSDDAEDINLLVLVPGRSKQRANFAVSDRGPLGANNALALLPDDSSAYLNIRSGLWFNLTDPSSLETKLTDGATLLWDSGTSE